MTNYELECFVLLKYGQPTMEQGPSLPRIKYLQSLPLDFLIQYGYASEFSTPGKVAFRRGYPNAEEVINRLVEYEAGRFNIYSA